MKDELEKKLQSDFPLLYKDLYGSADDTCLSRGIECGDGWFDLFMI